MNGKDTRIVIFGLLLLSIICVSGHEVVSLSTVDHDGVFRVDINTKNPLHHFTVTHVYACSSVDLEMETYNPENPSATGCNTPGFITRKIYGSGKIRDVSFHAQVKARSIVLNESVVDPRTPVVYVQVEMRVTDEDGMLMSPSIKSGPGDPFTLMARYTQSKKAPVDTIVLVNPPISDGAPHEIPWYYFTFGGPGIAGVCVMIGVALSRWKSNRSKRRLHGVVSGLDMETGESFGSAYEFIKERRASHVKWAILQGWWKTDD